MDIERWRQLETIVAAALELNRGQRAGYVADACGDDQDLRAEVEGLLGGETGAERMLENVELDITSPADRLIGSTIGPYRLESLLGFGGMGAVYLVHRTDGEFDQRAALKVIHGWMIDDQLRQRFLVERQVLASLDHSGIARLLDGGTTPDGTPYFVMEHIDGVSIDRYCDEHELDAGERIRLFLRICEAVTFAHRNLVVHRDIKPGNILIDATGQPKLLDFGIAKLLDPASFDLEQTLTRTGSRPMSPLYASPEHIRGDLVTTASDVYSLGAVLYTLLTGRPPRRLDDHSPRGLERAVSTSPRLPSAAATEGGRFASSHTRRLRGDLDAILLKALREEPEHRYSSIDELALDLQRHLDGHPVKARSGTVRYRSARFVRRNVAAVAVTSLVSLLVTTSIATLFLQNRRISYQRDRAQAIADFSSAMLDVDPLLWTIDPNRTTGSILRFNLNKSEGRLSVDPLVRRDQLILLAKSHLIAKNSIESIRLTRQATAISQSLPVSSLATEQRAMNDQGAMLIASGNSHEADAILDSAILLGGTQTNSDTREISRSLTLKALGDWNMSNTAAAKQNLESALRLTTEALGDDAIEVLILRALLGDLQLSENLGSEEAIALLSDGAVRLESQERASRLRLRLYRRLVDAHTFRGEYSLAIEAGRRGLALPSEVFGSDLVNLILKLGTLNFTRGELGTAVRHLNMGINVTADYHLQRTILMNSARAQLALGELTETRRECDLCSLLLLRRLRGRLGGLGLNTNPNLMVAALIDLWQGKPDQARAVAVRALEETDPPYFSAEWDLESHAFGAQIYHELGDDITAERLADRAIAIAEGTTLSWSPFLVRAQHLRAEILLRSGRVAEAQACLRGLGESIEDQQSIDPSPRINEQLANSHRIQGNLHQARGESELAEREWQEALRLLALNPDGAIGADHHLIAGEVHRRLGQTASAAEHARVLFGKGWRHPEWVATLGG